MINVKFEELDDRLNVLLGNKIGLFFHWIWDPTGRPHKPGRVTSKVLFYIWSNRNTVPVGLRILIKYFFEKF